MRVWSAFFSSRPQFSLLSLTPYMEPTACAGRIRLLRAPDARLGLAWTGVLVSYMHCNTSDPNTGESLVAPTAQQVLDWLPVPPARLLLWGGRAVGWEAMDVDVQSAALSQGAVWAQQPHLARTGVLEARLPSEGLEWDAVVVQDLSPMVHPLTIWDQLAERLRPGAVVVLTGVLPEHPRMPHWLDYVVALGQRCGFALLAPDGGDQATVPSPAFVRILRKAEIAPRWMLRHVRPQDAPSIAELFLEVFGHPISPALWEWKYGRGRGNAVTASRQGAVVAHYGGMYRDILLFGKPEWAFQICDVMVHPKERGVMTRQGPFLLTAAIGAEIYGPLGFGFPHPRAMEVAQKMGLYAPVGHMVEVRWQPSAPRARWATRLHLLSRTRNDDHALVDGVWRQMAADLVTEAVGLRDWAYLERRYLDHPHNHYELIAVVSRWTGRPLGILVLRRLEDCVELLDVVAPIQALPTLIDQARRLASLWGKSSVYCWITANQVHHFMVQGGVQTDVQVAIPTSVWTQDERAHVFKDKWWLMSGDTDFR